jgi:hypothetical protein
MEWIRAFVRRYPWGALGAAVLFLISGNLTASILWEMLSGVGAYFALMITLVVLISSMIILYDLRHSLLRIYANPQIGCSERYQGVLLFLSEPSIVRIPIVSIKIGDNKVSLNYRINDKENTKEIELDSNIKNFIGRISQDSVLRMWSWLPAFQGLAAHASRLKYIAVLCSKETQDYQDQIRHLLSVFFGKSNIKIIEELNFFDVNSIREGLGKAVREGLQLGLRKRDLVIDVTGGTKLASIGGVIYGVEEGVDIQYVQTKDPSVLICYNIFPRLLDVPS